MKRLDIYKEQGLLIVERTNEFGTTFRKQFETTKKMLDYLDVYKDTGKVSEYQITIEKELRPIVTNHFNC
ncbi:hypothetical protein [Rossellomorea marisflavi]|uniref:hypothetical protein n=1 Tax=Rossellomorea marisflavi TaxID=189381 RepID=UPI00064F8793|nr:hypothetical protein [Rossellomorea marisflavi]KML00556.1 hypothetical protein VL06_20770 [Rossellomorea marisflavi]